MWCLDPFVLIFNHIKIFWWILAIWLHATMHMVWTKCYVISTNEYSCCMQCIESWYRNGNEVIIIQPTTMTTTTDDQSHFVHIPEFAIDWMTFIPPMHISNFVLSLQTAINATNIREHKRKKGGILLLNDDVRHFLRQVWFFRLCFRYFLSSCYIIFNIASQSFAHMHICT